VDGLSGGAVTSALSAPALSATSMSFDVADGKTLSVEEVSTERLNVRGTVVSAGIARPAPLLINAFGFPIGTVDASTSIPGPGYAGVNAKCAESFPAGPGDPSAHVCTQQEIFIAVQTDPTAIPEAVVGAAYNTFTFGAPFELVDGTRLHLDDCLAWGSKQNPFFYDPGTGPSSGPAAATLGKNEDGQFLPAFQACGGDITVACCR